jgi:hypothetical protein
MSKFITIRLDAGHDVNGNPRRVYVVHNTAEDYGPIVAVYDERYAGRRAITNRYHRAAWGGYTYKTTPGQYRDLIRQSKDFEGGAV